MIIRTLTTRKIRTLGKDEYWLQDYICNNSSCLGLGELEVIGKERTQRGGGRLDILMKHRDSEAFYEVEVMLGDTDESHIIRTIEYWDLEKRRWPKRNHTAVLVAEGINSRFFNVISILSNAVPIIGIQVGAVPRDEEFDLIFTKIIDTYQEPELDEELADKGQLRELANHVTKGHEILLPEMQNRFKGLNYVRTKYGYTYFYEGKRVIKIHERGRDRMTIQIYVADDLPECNQAVVQSGVAYDNKYGSLRLWMTIDELRANLGLINIILDSDD